MRHSLAALVCLACLVAASGSTALAEPLRGPALAVASRFGQGYVPDLIAGAARIPVTDFRDELFWFRAEAGGRAVFDQPMTTYPDDLAGSGATVSIMVNNGHPDYDGGGTPLSEEAVAGFARHAARLVARFPNVTSIEVGNEFNSEDFVSGALEGSSIDARVRSYAALLAATHAAVKAVRPDVRILGGGVHSVPTGWLERLFALGAAAHMDTLALHPYSTPTDHLARHLEVLRRQKAARTIPIELTEFGSQDAASAPGELLKAHCEGALSGVSRIVWYALEERGDRYVPLLDAKGGMTPMGQVFSWVQRDLAGVPVVPFQPDPFTKGCLYDGRILVVWGAARQVGLRREGLRSETPEGKPAQPALSPDTPLVIRSESGPLEPDRDLALAPLQLLADTYDQFTYPGGSVAEGAGGAFVRTVRTRGVEQPFRTMPGHDRGGVPWVPYLGLPDEPDLRLTESWLVPVGWRARPVEIVHRWTAPEATRAEAGVRLAPLARSRDGLWLRVTAGDQTLYDGIVAGGEAFALDKRISLEAGESLEIAVGPNGGAEGDLADYRFTLRRIDP